LEHRAPDDPPEDVYRDHVGIHRQRQEGFVYAGVAVLRGRLTPTDMRRAADLAERYGTGELRTTSMQNLLIPNVRRERVGALAAAPYSCVAAAPGRPSTTPRPIGLRAPATDVGAAIERLLRAFLAERLPGENFRQFCARHTDEELRARLAGGLVEVVERDVPAGRPPHGVDG